MSQASFDTSTSGGAGTAAMRYVLGALLSIVTLSAFGGGWYGMSGAEAIPPEWLEGSPFRDYFVPSLILFVVVGGSSLLAAVATLARLTRATAASLGAGAILIGWIGIETASIGYRSWLQVVTMLTGLLVMVLTLLLPHPRLRIVGPLPRGSIHCPMP